MARLSARFESWRSGAYLQRRHAILEQALRQGDLPAGARELLRLRHQVRWSGMGMAAVLISILVILCARFLPSVRDIPHPAPSAPPVVATVREVAP